jgi:hypothetical protein
LPNTLAALEQTASYLRNTGYTNYGLRVPAGIPGRTLAAWGQIAEEIIRLQPAHVEFAVVNAGADNGSGF